MKEEIVRLIELMKENNIDYYLVETSDDHNSEYTAKYFQVRAYLSGFTGSAGSLLISQTKAYLWTDGRYFIQAAGELDGSEIELMKMGEKGVPSISNFLAINMKDGQKLAYDGRTVSAKYELSLKERLSSLNISIENEIDLAGQVYDESNNRPAMTFSKIVDYSVEYAGLDRTAKLDKLRMYMNVEEIEALVITALDDIAWLFNIRANDVPYNPVAMAYATIYKDKADLYLNIASLDDQLKLALEGSGINIKAYADFYQDIKALDIKLSGDKNSVNAVVLKAVKSTGGRLINSPISLWKAVKNKTEIEGMRKAHINDGIAFARFMTWLDGLETDFYGNYVDEDDNCLTEIDMANKLEEERKKFDSYQEPSFEPISAIKDHGAIIHYSADEESNADICSDTFLLMDTGAQYLSGTTDITRT
nr:aminopeptidase P family N-terminal domain-containing protein [Lachnospiraceae bacterium]